VLQQLLPAGAFVFLLAFARLGAILMVMPGIGEAYVAPPVRLALALALTLTVSPSIAPGLPALPGSPFGLLFLVGVEIVIGLFVGGIARLLITSLQVAGNIISLQSGLGSAMFFDPNQGAQGAAFANFMTLVGVTCIFAADLHLLLLRAAVDSYSLFPVGRALPSGEFAELAGRMVADSFLLGVQISAPFLVYGLIFNVGLGLLNRLMPTLQVFFIMTPIQIVVALGLFALTLSAGTAWFLDHFEESGAALLARS